MNSQLSDLFTLADRRNLLNQLAQGASTPQTGVIYASPTQAFITLDGTRFAYYATAEWAAEDTGATTIVTVTAEEEAQLLGSERTREPGQAGVSAVCVLDTSTGQEIYRRNTNEHSRLPSQFVKGHHSGRYALHWEFQPDLAGCQ